MFGRWKRSAPGILVAAVTFLQVFAAPASAAVPEPGPGRALWGGPLNLQAKEPALGRPLDVVRIYSSWATGPPAVNTTQLGSLTTGGRRTLMVNATIPWVGWRDQARRLNSDADPANNVPEPYCKTRPVVPGTTQASGKTWFGAVADGDYDPALRRWLEQLAGLATETPALYVSFHHEADRLSDGGTYQPCVGYPAQYRAAWRRLRLVAEGAAGGVGTGPNLTRRGGGPLVLTPIFTTWGFWHTASTPTSPSRVLIRPATGQPIPGGSADDLSLRSARVTEWVPAAGDYDVLATDVFNYVGSPAGGGIPTGVRVDDPATATVEEDQWRSLQVLVQPFMLWATNFAALPDGSTRPLMLAEYGSVPDPTRPSRRATWVGDACRFLSAPAQARFQAALYFDQNQMRLATWSWRKLADGRWSAIGTTGTDTPTVAALAQVGASTRFGGTSACP